MRTCDRCKDPKKQVRMLLTDRKDATEYDFCVDCANAFLTFLNPQEKPVEALAIKSPQTPKDRKKS